jgi:L-seryl-tRNA(Ser) seleniumtransferase
LRCDKICLAALQTTANLHLNRQTAEIPTLVLLQTSEHELHTRAAAACSRLQGLPLEIHIGRGKAKAGGGSLPESNLSSITIDIVPRNASVDDFAATLRASNPPVIGYIADSRFKLDLRTIFPHQDDLVIEAIRTACGRTR